MSFESPMPPATSRSAVLSTASLSCAAIAASTMPSSPIADRSSTLSFAPEPYPRIILSLQQRSIGKRFRRHPQPLLTDDRSIMPYASLNRNTLTRLISSYQFVSWSTHALRNMQNVSHTIVHRQSSMASVHATAVGGRRLVALPHWLSKRHWLLFRVFF